MSKYTEILEKVTKELYQSKEWQGIVTCSLSSVTYSSVQNDPSRKQLQEKILANISK